ncbi:MAG: hypothetical protein Q4C83_00070 [Candidatus Saccharibacteria bacterium]|nr:hypothetical protein [Candidatus Saccharibacteria bacterium]
MKRIKLTTKQIHLLIAAIAFIIIIIIVLISFNKTSNNVSNDIDDASEEVIDDDSSVNDNTIISEPDKRQVATIGKIDQVKNLPVNEINMIYHQLENTLKSNGFTDKINDAVIRDNSYNQQLIDSNYYIYFTTFIVDIPSIQRSYVIENKYSPLPATTTGLVDYTTLALCPDSSQQIYGDSDCVDRLKLEEGNE